MINKLIVIFSFLCCSYLHAQVYTSGVVSLSSTAGLAMTAKMDVGTQVTLTLTGPSGRWFALGFDATSMGSGNDVVAAHSSGTLSAFDASIGGYSAPTADPVQNWTIVSDQVSAGVRTIVATRALDTGDPNDHVFTAAAGPLSLIWARSGSATYSYSYHGSSNRGITTANFTLVPPPAAPTGSANQTFCSGATIAQLNAAGSNVQWYANASGGSALQSSTALTNNTTYYASQTVNGVESINRLAVTVIVNSIPSQPAAIVGDAHFCNGGLQPFSIGSVANATSYVWTTPNGSTGSSTGTSINLLFAPSFVSGALSVAAQNNCGQSSPSTINIYQHFPYTNSLTVSSCTNYTFNGQTYTQSGTYSFQDTTIWGCDSAVVLNLTISNEIITNLSDSACGSYNWNGQTFFQDGVYVDSLQAVSGCDSIVILNLVVNPIYSLYLDSTVYDSLVWNGQTYLSNGQNSQFFTSMDGCDSTVTINLTVLVSGLDELDKIWRVYPNPLSGTHHLYVNGLAGGTFILFDSKGSKLKMGDFTNQIDLSGFQTGIYFLKIDNRCERICLE